MRRSGACCGPLPGALLDSRGRLIGICSAIYSPSGASSLKWRTRLNEYFDRSTTGLSIVVMTETGAFSGVGMAIPLDTVLTCRPH